MEKLIGINELSELIGAKRQTIYAWVHEHFIPFHKVGGMVRFRQSEIEEWIDNRKKNRKRKVEEGGDTDA